MPHFVLYDIVKWLHLITLTLGGGGIMVALILTGLEAQREEFQGLSSLLWKRAVAWAMRLAVLLGLALLFMKFQMGQHPFENPYLHLKLTLVFFLLMMSEMSPRTLAGARKGAPMLALLLFLLASFVTVNKNAFRPAARKAQPSIPVEGHLVPGP